MLQPGSTPRPQPARSGLLALGLALVLMAGCNLNRISDLLVPTGLRPRPEVGTGGITAQLDFDPAQFPDLAAPPYPPTLVRLYLDGSPVDSLMLDGSTRMVRFDALFGGTYAITSSAYLFFPSTLGPIPVVDRLVDAGNDTLQVNPSRIVSTVHLAADFNGFPPDFPDSIAMVQNRLGLWSYPNLDYPAQTIAPGTYRLRFVTDFSFDNPTDYGGSETVTLTPPVRDAPTSLVSGSGTNLKIRIDTGGQYSFTLDERRQTFSVEPLVQAMKSTTRRHPS